MNFVVKWWIWNYESFFSGYSRCQKNHWTQGQKPLKPQHERFWLGKQEKFQGFQKLPKIFPARGPSVGLHVEQGRLACQPVWPLIEGLILNREL